LFVRFAAWFLWLTLLSCFGVQGSELDANKEREWQFAVIDDPDRYVNLRSESNTRAEVVARLQENEVFLVGPDGKGKWGAWHEAKTLGGKDGYVHRNHIRIVQSMSELGRWAVVNSLPLARPPDWLLTQDHFETLLSPDRPKVVSSSGFNSGWMWFRNKDSGQTMVVDLYTDNFPITTILFSNDHADYFIVEHPDLLLSKGGLADPAEVRAHWGEFAAQAKELDPKYFATEQGVKLGASVDEVIAVYGEPHRQASAGKLQTLWWDYVGRESFWYAEGSGDMLVWRMGSEAGVDMEKLLKVGKVGVVPRFEFSARAIFSDGKLVCLVFERGIP
jgi:hypothetical protein